MTQVWLLIGVGGLGGFFIGRWSAESGRARFDMNNTWNGRKKYRGR